MGFFMSFLKGAVEQVQLPHEIKQLNSNLLYTLLVAALLHRLFVVLGYYRARLNNPGFVSVFRPGWVPALALHLPMAKHFNIQPTLAAHSQFDWFRESKSTTITITSIFPAGNTVYVADPDTAAILCAPDKDGKEIIGDMEFTSVVNVWGPTIISSVGETWKRHRRIASVSFSKSNIMMVWTESRRVLAQGLFGQMNREADGTGTFSCPDVARMTLNFGIRVISASAFGRTLAWDDDAPQPGHKLGIATALNGAFNGLVPKRVFPEWLLNLTGQTQNCFAELELTMTEMIAERAKELQMGLDEHHDLFSKLMKANIEETNPARRITDMELMADTFLFLFGGHETSGRNMGFTLVLLALYHEEQEKVFEEVSHVLPNDPNEITSYDECVPKLVYTRGVIQESLRLFPAATVVRRRAQVDIVAPSHVIVGDKLEPSTIFIGKGDYVAYGLFGAHANPFVWGEAPESFKPSRSVDLTKFPKHAWMPFGNGGRICIGKDFAMTEMLCYISHMVRYFKVDFPEDTKATFRRRQNETERQHLHRVFQTQIPATLCHQKIGLTFTRRQ